MFSFRSKINIIKSVIAGLWGCYVLDTATSENL